MENYVTYAYEDVTVDGKKAEKVTATMKDDSTSVVIKDLNGNTLSTILGGETVNYTYNNKNRLTAISGRSDGASEGFTFDALDNLSGYVYNDGSKDVASETYAYNANRQLASKTVDGKTYTYTYTDDTAKSLESVSVDGFFTLVDVGLGIDENISNGESTSEIVSDAVIDIVGGAWSIGAGAIGTKLGSAIGTAIAPGIGTALGSVIGYGLGVLIGAGLNWIFDECIDPAVDNAF